MNSQFLFIGTTELLLIGGIALLLFGGKKLPEMMHGLGQGVREFKKGVNEIKEEAKSEDSNDNAPNDDSQEKQETITPDRKQEKADGKGK
ncbi:MAG: twin-arginine translocase TatA/TatE family subunit [Prevotella sp.]